MSRRACGDQGGRGVPHGATEGRPGREGGSAGRPAAECGASVRSRAFLEYYQEHLEYACPTEDIYLE